MVAELARASLADQLSVLAAEVASCLPWQHPCGPCARVRLQRADRLGRLRHHDCLLTVKPTQCLLTVKLAHVHRIARNCWEN